MYEPIPISALQHYVFCPRQCAYIHSEQLWFDNALSAEGKLLHERVHSQEAESRGKLRTERGVRVFSEKLRIAGVLDLLEIDIALSTVIPIEYKRGKPKTNDSDRVQLCAQALCLEEMRGIHIPRAFIWYWQVRKREKIELDDQLRSFTIKTIEATRELLHSGRLPKAVYKTSCKACSFFDHCSPRERDCSVAYTAKLFQDEDLSQ